MTGRHERRDTGGRRGRRSRGRAGRTPRVEPPERAEPDEPTRLSDLMHADPHAADLIQADLVQADLVQAHLMQADVGHAHLVPADRGRTGHRRANRGRGGRKRTGNVAGRHGMPGRERARRPVRHRTGGLWIPVAAFSASAVLAGVAIAAQTRQALTGGRSAAQTPSSASAAPPVSASAPGGTAPDGAPSGTLRPSRSPAERRSAGRPSRPPSAGVPGRGRRLVRPYEVVGEVDARGPSGFRRTAALRNRFSLASTGFWVGCDGEPAITRFTLGGSFRSLRTILLLDRRSPAALEVRVVIAGDGRPLIRRTLNRRTRAPIRVPTAGVRTLSLEAQAVGVGGCRSLLSGYGIAFDAALRPL